MNGTEILSFSEYAGYDLSKISADQQAFLAQKDQPDGKKTMKSYLWSLEKVAYDQAHNG